MLVIEVKVKGADKLAAKFALFKAYIDAGLLDAWTEIASSLHKKIVAATPKESTQLVRSTVPRVMPWRVQSIASAIDEKTGFNYARIQHDGGIGASVRYGRDRKKYFHIDGKHYMTNPLWATAPEVPPILEKEIAKIIAICGLG
jgi:hypothetical protein